MKCKLYKRLRTFHMVATIRPDAWCEVRPRTFPMVVTQQIREVGHRWVG